MSVRAPSLVSLAAFVSCLAGLAGCSAAPADDSAASTDSSNAALSTSAYVASDAVTYADDHWDDGVGECAEFVSHSLRAGHLNIPVISYVPTLYQAFAKVAFDEHDGTDAASASAGDVVMFSDASGSDFCDVSSSDEANCGHVCIVTVAGTDASSIAVDCHNNAHHEIAVSGLLGGEYSYFRVYHLASGKHAAAAPGRHARLLLGRGLQRRRIGQRQGLRRDRRLLHRRLPHGRRLPRRGDLPPDVAPLVLFLKNVPKRGGRRPIVFRAPSSARVSCRT